MSRVLKVKIMYKRAEPITVRGRGGQANYRGEVFTVASSQQVLRGYGEDIVILRDGTIDGGEREGVF